MIWFFNQEGEKMLSESEIREMIIKCWNKKEISIYIERIFFETFMIEIYDDAEKKEAYIKIMIVDTVDPKFRTLVFSYSIIKEKEMDCFDSVILDNIDFEKETQKKFVKEYLISIMNFISKV